MILMHLSNTQGLKTGKILLRKKALPSGGLDDYVLLTVYHMAKRTTGGVKSHNSMTITTLADLVTFHLGK